MNYLNGAKIHLETWRVMDYGEQSQEELLTAIAYALVALVEILANEEIVVLDELDDDDGERDDGYVKALEIK